VKREIK